MFNRDSYTQARIQTRIALRKQVGVLKAIQAMNNWDDGLLDTAVDQVSATNPELGAEAAATMSAVGAIGDGTILKAIIDFFKGPQGQQIIDAVVKLLLHLIA
jgi:hypothetical protein